MCTQKITVVGNSEIRPTTGVPIKHTIKSNITFLTMRNVPD